MGGACSMYGGEEMCKQHFGEKNLKEKNLEDLSVNGRILLKRIFQQ
jgi:hypothetical protein